MNARMKRLVASAVLPAAGLALAAPEAVAGPVSVVSQDRSVRVSIPSIELMEPAVNETVSAPGNGTFDETLERTLNQMTETNTARATQVSRFGNAGDVFAAKADAESNYSATGLPGIVFAESKFALQFELDDVREFTLNGSGSFPDTGSGASNFNVILTGPGGTVASFTKADFNPNNNDGAQVSPVFSTQGTLDPGLYTLSAVTGVSGGPNIGGIDSAFGFEFAASSTAIPLPAAAGPAGLLLLGIVGRALQTRWRR